MDSDPNIPGSNDEDNPDDDLEPTYDSHPETPADQPADPDTNIDSIDAHASPNHGHADATADSVETKLDSIKSQDAPAPLTNKLDPTSENEVPLANHPPSQSDSDDFSDLADMSLIKPGDTGSNSERARDTAAQFEPTLDGVSGDFELDADNEDFKFSHVQIIEENPANIGRYEIIRLLGEGTFGKVYEARDPQLDRIVAIKVAKSISGRTQVKRFLREARAAAQLRHPSIIPVYEYGQIAGENIIVYEFVAGESLKSYLRKHKPLPISESVEIVRQIAEGLNYAHEQGIIHRDMKPDNVLIDPTGHPHIADFGCARAIEDKSNLTIDGSILGTPMYMSPEQAGGRSNLADARTDIWSLGVMLYEMVGGKKPFDGKLSDLLYSICNKDPLPLRKIRPDVPLDIETICRKCLTREVDNRFDSAKILADELARFQRGEPIQSRRVNTIQRTWMWAKRNQAVASLISAVVMTMLIGTIVSSRFAILAYLEKQQRATAQLNALTTAEPNALPGIFESLTPFQATIVPKLNEKLDNEFSTGDERRRWRMAIVELEPDTPLRPQQADEFVNDLLAVEPEEFFVIRSCLETHKQALTAALWKNANDVDVPIGRRFRAAAALALYDYDPNSEDWLKIAPDIADHLTSLNEIEASKWLPALTNIRATLRPRLEQAYIDRADPSDRTPERTAAILASLFSDDIVFLTGLAANATPRQIPYLTDAMSKRRTESLAELKKALNKQDVSGEPGTSRIVEQSNLIVAMIQLSDSSPWHQLAGGTDMSVATELIERLGPASTPVEFLTTQIKNRKSVQADVLSGILLALGQYKPNQILGTQRVDLKSDLLYLFSNHPDARVHSSARWLLQNWEFEDAVTAAEQRLRRPQPDPLMNWHVDSAGNTFALFGPGTEFEMGWNDLMKSGSEVEVPVNFDEPQHRKLIPRRFGICIYEVTNQQFIEFENDLITGYGNRAQELETQIADLPELADDADDEAKQQRAARLKELNQNKQKIGLRRKEAERRLKRRREMNSQDPVEDVDFFKSLAYCRWLSEQQELACGLPPVEELQDLYLGFPDEDIMITQEHLDRLGYRLPTATEWEYACRGRSKTLFPFGRSAKHANRYAWFAANSVAQVHPVGQLKPGITGLYDALGNVSEWCLDWYDPELPDSNEIEPPGIYVDFGPEFESRRRFDREFRGGSWLDDILSVRPTKRFSMAPNKGQARVGFRLARTYEPSTGPKASPVQADIE